ncbi:hypothetical protein V2G26_005482 [Clonostachys chloroleuca]
MIPSWEFILHKGARKTIGVKELPILINSPWPCEIPSKRTKQISGLHRCPSTQKVASCKRRKQRRFYTSAKQATTLSTKSKATLYQIAPPFLYDLCFHACERKLDFTRFARLIRQSTAGIEAQAGRRRCCIGKRVNFTQSAFALALTQHPHPSKTSPQQCAATGAGGIYLCDTENKQRALLGAFHDRGTYKQCLDFARETQAAALLGKHLFTACVVLCISATSDPIILASSYSILFYTTSIQTKCSQKSVLILGKLQACYENFSM